MPRSSPPSTAGAPCTAPPSVSTGPAATLVTVELMSPSTASSGASIALVARLVVRSDGPRIILQPTTSAVVVLDGTTVVARAVGPAGAAVPLQLRAGERRPAQTVPERLDLVGCDGSPLPAGRYAVRALVGYGGDPLNAGSSGQPGAFVLVSEPQTLVVS